MPCSDLFSVADMTLNTGENFSDKTKYFIQSMVGSANAMLKYSNSMLQVLCLNNHNKLAVFAQLSWKDIVQNIYRIYKTSVLLKNLIVKGAT